MTRDEAITRMRRLLGFNQGLSQTVLEDALVDAQNSMEREPEYPWFLRTEISSISTAVGEERIPLPPDFLMIVEDDALWHYDSTLEDPWAEILKDDLDKLRAYYSGADAGPPEHYALDATYFRVFPTPDAAYQLKMIYYAKDTALTSNVENKWLTWFPLLLVGMAVQSVAGPTRDAAAVQLGMKMEQAERERMRTMNTAREMANKSIQMGGED